MERLIAQIGLTYLSVLSVVFYFGRESAVVIGVVSLVLFVVFLVSKKCKETVYLPTIACVALFACVVNLCYSAFVYDRIVQKFDNYSGKVTATLIEEPSKVYDSYRYMFKANLVDDEREAFRFMVYDDEFLMVEPFDVVEMEVSLSGTEKATSLSKKCFLNGTFGFEEAQYKIVGSENWRFRYFAIKLRGIIREAFRDSLSEDTFALCSALMIGDKYVLSDEIIENFRQAGATHLIVVSGMHFSILAAIFLKIAQKLWRHRNFFIVPCVLFILLYMGITGFTPSVVRSAVMLLICCWGLAISREPYSPNSLGVAAIVVTLFNPFSVGDVGLILSFATTFSIITLAPILEGKFLCRIKPPKFDREHKFKSKIIRCPYNILKSIAEVICMNISAFAVSLPLSLAFFSSTSTVSIVSTLILCLPINALLIISFLIALVYYIPVLTLIAPLLSVCAEVISDFTLWVVELFANLPFSYVSVNNSYVYLWLVMSLILVALVFFCKNKAAAVKACALSVVAVFLAGFVTSSVIDIKTATLNIYDVGDGTAVMYEDSAVTAVLELDCNSSRIYTAVDKIESDSDTVDFCSSVSDTSASAKSLYTLTKVFAISDVLLYDTKRTVEIGDAVDNVITPCGNYTVELSENATAEYVLTDDGYIIYLNCRGVTALVLPSYSDVENIPADYRKADYIIMGNSPYNSQLLSCDTLVISQSSEYAYNVMKFTDVCYERVLLTADDDIEIMMEV